MSDNAIIASLADGVSVANLMQYSSMLNSASVTRVCPAGPRSISNTWNKAGER